MVRNLMKGAYPELVEQCIAICQMVLAEENIRFARTLRLDWIR